MQVRCPHCQNGLELLHDSDLSEVVCPSCGSSFSLTEGDTVAHHRTEGGRLAHFELLEKIGSGAFGSVWRARDTILQRIVAIKIPRQEQFGEQESERFFREARAVAQLRHPNIVPVHEVGRDKDTVYIVSDFIDGVTLTDRLTARRPTFAEAARLCATICRALQHAHGTGVIHRDMKPSNIMIDVDGQPHLMDFGLAKRQAGEITMTYRGQILGTPAYMSPEQAIGQGHAVDRRADVYALGAILFEMLTGERPFRGNVRMLLHQVVHEEAPSPRTLNNNVPKDLDTICLKCLEKLPRQRYDSCGKLADEFDRYLRDEPIHARPISNAARAWRWCRRNPVVAGLATALIASLLIGLGGITTQWLRAEYEARRAQISAQQERRAREDTRRRLYAAHMNLVADAYERADPEGMIDLLDRHVPLPDQADLRGFEWYYWKDRCRRFLRSMEERQDVTTAAFSPDGTLVASAGHEATVTLWDAANGEITQTLVGHGDWIWAIQFSPDGRTLASACEDGQILLWDLATQQVRHRFEADDAVRCLSFSHDGGLLASGDQQGAIGVWDVATGERKRIFQGHDEGVYSVVFAPDDSMIASAGRDGNVRLWDSQTLRQQAVLSGHERTVRSVAFTSDGRTLASGSSDGTVRLWSVPEGKCVEILEEHESRVYWVEFSPDDQTLASAGEDRRVVLWDVPRRERRFSIRGHLFTVFAARFSPQGTELLTCSQDKTIKLWDLGPAPRIRMLEGHEYHVYGVAFQPSGNRLISASGDPAVKIWDLSTGQVRQSLNDFTENVWGVAISPDGRVFATAGGDGMVRLWDTAHGQLIQKMAGHSDEVATVDFSPDGAWLASCSDDANIGLWDVSTGKLRHLFRGHEGRVYDVDFSPDGATLASASADETVRIWSVDRREPLKTLRGHRYRVYCVRYSPQGDFLASGGQDRGITVRATGDFSVSQQMRGHVASVHSVAFTKDGKTLASVSSDKTVRLWDVATGDQKTVLRGHTYPVYCVAFSRDDRVLASASEDRTIRLWHQADEMGQAPSPQVTSVHNEKNPAR